MNASAASTSDALPRRSRRSGLRAGGYCSEQPSATGARPEQPRRGPPGPRRPRPAVSVQELLRSSAQLFAATLLKCLPLSMLGTLCAQLPSIYALATGEQLRAAARSHDAVFGLLTLLGSVLQLWIFAALMLRQRAVVLRAPVQALSELRAAAERLPSLLLGVVLALLAVALGVALLLVPGIYLGVCFLTLLPVLLFERLDPLSALRRSVQLVRPLWWQALTALVLASLLFVIGGLLAAAILAAIASAPAGHGPVLAAVETAGTIGFGATYFLFLSALLLVLHSAASSSA